MAANGWSIEEVQEAIRRSKGIGEEQQKLLGELGRYRDFLAVTLNEVDSAINTLTDGSGRYPVSGGG